MIIVDRDIHKLIQERTIVIISGDPTQPFDPNMQIGPGSIDLRVNNVFRKYKPDIKVIDLSNQNDTDIFEIPASEDLIINPNEIIITTTLENVILPPNIAGIITGRSSIARLGLLVQVSQDYVQPGQAQAVGLQLVNVTNRPIRVKPFSAICQIALMYTTSKTDNPYGTRKTSKYKDEYVTPLPPLASSEQVVDGSPSSMTDREQKIRAQVNRARQTVFNQKPSKDLRAALSRINSTLLVILGGTISIVINELDAQPLPSTKMIISGTITILLIAILIIAHWE